MHNFENEIQIIRSARKTLAVEISKEAAIIVRAPYRVSDSEIAAFLEKNKSWIAKHIVLQRERLKERKAQAQTNKTMTEQQIRSLTEQAKIIIPARVRYYAEQMNVTYGRITIRHQRTRWGSCSSKGNLNFNCLLMLTPIEVVDYVVIHELAHRKQMNHSAAFWREVEQMMPDYRVHRRWLKTNGQALIERL